MSNAELPPPEAELREPLVTLHRKGMSPLHVHGRASGREEPWSISLREADNEWGYTGDVEGVHFGFPTPEPDPADPPVTRAELRDALHGLAVLLATGGSCSGRSGLRALRRHVDHDLDTMWMRIDEAQNACGGEGSDD